MAIYLFGKGLPPICFSTGGGGLAIYLFSNWEGVVVFFFFGIDGHPSNVLFEEDMAPYFFLFQRGGDLFIFYL